MNKSLTHLLLILMAVLLPCFEVAALQKDGVFLEPEPVPASAQQLAKIYWLPDYYGGYKDLNDNPSAVDQCASLCSGYSKGLTSCPEGYTLEKCSKSGCGTYGRCVNNCPATVTLSSAEICLETCGGNCVKKEACSYPATPNSGKTACTCPTQYHKSCPSNSYKKEPAACKANGESYYSCFCNIGYKCTSTVGYTSGCKGMCLKETSSCNSDEFFYENAYARSQKATDCTQKGGTWTQRSIASGKYCGKCTPKTCSAVNSAYKDTDTSNATTGCSLVSPAPTSAGQPLTCYQCYTCGSGYSGTHKSCTGKITESGKPGCTKCPVVTCSASEYSDSTNLSLSDPNMSCTSCTPQDIGGNLSSTVYKCTCQNGTTRIGSSCCVETVCNIAKLYNTINEAAAQCEWGDYTTPPAVFCSCGGGKKYKCPDRPCPGYDLDPGCSAYETPDYCSRNKEFYNCKPTCLSRISQLYGNRALIDPTPAEIEANQPEVIILTKDTTYTTEEVESFHFAQAVRSQISYADQFEECRNITARPLLTLSYNKMLTSPILIDKQDIQDVNLALSFSQAVRIGYAHINGRIANSDIQIIKDIFKPTGVSYSYRLTIGSPIKSEKNNKLKLAGEVTISSVKPYGLWVRDEMNASVGLEIADGAKVTINKHGGYNSENRDEGEAIMAYSPIHIGQNAEVKFLKDTRLFRAADNLINSIVVGEGATLETAYLGLNETAVDIRSGAKLSSSDDICMTSLSKTEDHYSRISAYKPGGTLVYKGKTVILNNNSGSNNFAMRMHAYTSGTTGKTQNTWCYSQRNAYAGVNSDVNWARVSTPTPISIPAEGL